MQKKSLINGLGRPHPDEQKEPEHPNPLPERGGLLGLERGCHHLSDTSTNRGIELHSNVVLNPGTTPALTSTTLALRKDTLLYPGP